MSTLRCGVIGLGAMGGPMALNLHHAGLLYRVWNRSPGPAQELSAATGVVVADSPRALADDCNVVLTCVSADKDVEEVIGSMSPGLAAGSIVVDTSTVSPRTAETLAARLAEIQVGFVDAPVSGGVEGARKGKLSVMAGGKSADIQRIQPVLDAISARVTHMGPSGSGQATKAVNQVIVGGIAEAVCEALALAEKLNLPPERLLSVLGAGAASSWFLEHRGASMLEDRFDEGFKLSLLLKDLKIIQKLAQDLDIQMGVVESAIADFERLVAAGEGNHDISGLIRLKRLPAGTAGG